MLARRTEETVCSYMVSGSLLSGELLRAAGQTLTLFLMPLGLTFLTVEVVHSATHVGESEVDGSRRHKATKHRTQVLENLTEGLILICFATAGL